MKTKPFVILASVLALLFAAQSSSAQTRIRFARGAVRANVSGTLNGYRGTRTYVIKVREGQTLRTEQLGSRTGPITITIQGPNGEDVGDSDASCNNRKEISPTEAGDYTIAVVECRKADAWQGRFTFRVTVR